ncbi:putative nucleoside transporter [Wilcoxina mikolae CBS 423.85]|nr:putative nucleoside transporter [Wilcoxina mikolae CBS 423.85]
MADPEKQQTHHILPTATDISRTSSNSATLSLLQRIEKLEGRIGVEVRGIERVPLDERIKTTTFNTVQITMTWCSINLVSSNMLVGMLGPHVFGLSFRDSALLCFFGNLLGTLGPAYISSLGPSGNRTMVILRFVFGWWPAKICAVLQLIANLGYALLSALICGQTLSAVSKNGSMTVVVGVIIAAIIALIVCVVGMRVFHVYERWAMIPQIFVFFIMVGCAGPYFDTTSPSVGSPAIIRGNQISFFFACFNNAFVWAMCAADYFVYYPESTPRIVLGTMSYIGLFLGTLFSELLGVGLASGATSKPEWSAAFAIDPGALMVEAYAPLGGFGKFCAVVLALGPIGNTIPGVYSSALAWQLLSHTFLKVPRTVWTVFGIIIYTVCAIAGRNNIFTVFENFLALMGYWVIQWVTIHFEEEFIFKRVFRWEDWNDAKKLPVGLAAMAAFLIGWTGAILSMYQVWWVGPLAQKAYGDIGVPVSGAWAAVAYLPLRWAELKYLGR